MNPDKLFDYLDGKLPDWERQKLEEQLMDSAELRRELTVAREIHRAGNRSREVLGATDEDLVQTQRGAVLGRRFVTLFGALVLLNVFVGIFVIVNRHEKKGAGLGAKEAAMRAQLSASLEKAGNIALPPPVIAHDIEIATVHAERDPVANKVVAVATQLGGTATKALPDEKSIVVLAEVPGDRETAFRQALASFGGPMFSPGPTGSPNEKTLFQVKIVDLSLEKAP
jgi:hypothetical protein